MAKRRRQGGENSRKMALMHTQQNMPQSTPRYLCSQLVQLVSSEPRAPEYREQWVNLEEIWDGGAVLECDEEVGAGMLATIFADGVSFSGRVTAVERHEIGWRVEMAFSAQTPWNIEFWQPEHALDAEALGQ